MELAEIAATLKSSSEKINLIREVFNRIMAKYQFVLHGDNA